MPYTNSFLIPGSTGDGWELDFEEFKKLLKFFFEYEPILNINVLVGLLQTDRDKLNKNLEFALDFFKQKNISIISDEYKQSRFKGFVLCPPKGKDTAQDKIKSYLENFLSLNYPVSLYQLPQITENEILPETISELSKNFSNFYMLKDSSGTDNIAKSDTDYNGLILLRGAELDYSKWFKGSYSKKYNGFLLSTANSFPKELSQIVTAVEVGNLKEAADMSSKLSGVVSEIFKVASSLSFGNAFTNANKLVDHINAYGSKWADNPLPKTHSGKELPKELIEKTYNLLIEKGFCVGSGYLNY